MNFTITASYNHNGCRNVSNDGKLIETLPVATKDSSFDVVKCVFGNGLAAGRHDGQIFWWKYQAQGYSCSQGVLFGKHDGPILSIEYLQQSESTGLLFTGSSDRTIKVWDPSKTRDMRCIQTLCGHGGSITLLKLVETLLLSASNDRTIKLWRRDKGRQLLLYPWYILTQSVNVHNNNWATCISLRGDDSSQLYFGDSSGHVLMYAVNHSAELHPKHTKVNEIMYDILQFKKIILQVHTLAITNILCIPDQNIIATLSFDCMAHFFDGNTGIISYRISNPNQVHFTSLNWDKPMQEIFLSDMQGSIHVYNICTETVIKCMQIQHSPIHQVSLLPKNNSMLIGCQNGAIKYTIDRTSQYSEHSGHQDAILAVIPIEFEEPMDIPTQDIKYSSSSCLFSASIDNTIRSWDPYDMKVLYGFEETESEISCMIYSKQYRRIFTGNENGVLKQWNIDNGQYCTSKQHLNTISCMAIAYIDQDEMLLTGDYDGVLIVWEISIQQSPIVYYQLQTGDMEIYCILFSSGFFMLQRRYEFFITGHKGGMIQLWKLEGCEHIQQVHGHQEAITAIACDGCFLFSGSEDCTVKIWNMVVPESTYELGHIQAHTMTISDLLVIPDNGLLVSTSFDGTIRIWNYQSCTSQKQYATLLYEFEKKNERIKCMAYWPSIQKLVCGTNECHLLCFTLPSHVMSTENERAVVTTEQN